MRLWSWQGLLGLSGGAIFLAPYDARDAPMWFARDCASTGNGSDGTLCNDFYETDADGGGRDPNPRRQLIYADVPRVRAERLVAGRLGAEYAASETIPSQLKLPVLIFEGSGDTTVLPADADAYVAKLQAAGVTVDYGKFPAGRTARRRSARSR